MGGEGRRLCTLGTIKGPFVVTSFTRALALCLAEQLASGLVSSQGDKGLGLAVTYVLNIGFRI